jgi:4-amino-4-deoxy-L-arabinose transferase-like glycosyltransferase
MATDCLLSPKSAERRAFTLRYALPLLLLLTFAVRMPGLSRPLLGNFATRNVAQAMAARNWARGAAPWWRPTLDVLADGEPSWHLVEVPISAYVSGALWHLLGGSLDAWGRATAIIWSMLSVALLFKIVERRCGSNAALGAGFVLAISPLGIIYGQSFLLEPSVVALALAAWWGTENYLESPQWRWLCLIGAALCLLWLTKIYMLALAAPLAWLLWQQRDCRGNAPLRFGLILVCAAIPCAVWVWQVWLLAGPQSLERGHVYYSLFSSAAEHRFPHPMLATPSFYARQAIDLLTVVLTPVGALLACLGLRHVRWRTWWPLAAVMLGLMLLMPRKFFEMNYYHLLFLPAWAGVVGLGWRSLSESLKARRWVAPVILLATLAFSARYSLRPAFNTPMEDRSVLAAADALQALAGPDDRIVTAHGATLDLLYYCDRRGWSLPLNSEDFSVHLQQRAAEGARWFVIADTSPLQLSEDTAKALRAFPIAARGDGYRIYELSCAADAERSRSAAKTAMPTAPGAR